MKDYLDEALNFIESTEMRDYLREVLRDKFKTNSKMCGGRYICAVIVSYAPATLEQKIPVLDLIAEQTKAYRDSDFRDPAKFARQSRLALEERYKNPPGTIFWLRNWNYQWEAGSDFGYKFFTEFDAAVNYIRQQMERDKEFLGLNPENYNSHSIEKYIPGKNGVLEEYCTWILNHSGEIWYFDYDSTFSPKDWDDIWDYLGCNLNLPTPFYPGDIIIADCRPFAKERCVLIADIGDNADCCSLQSIHITPNGKLTASAFKHNAFLHDTEYSHVSGLYRAAKYHGELTECEKPLAVMSAAIKASPDLGKKILDFIWGKLHDIYNKYHKFPQINDNEYIGAEWEQIKTEFNL